MVFMHICLPHLRTSQGSPPPQKYYVYAELQFPRMCTIKWYATSQCCTINAGAREDSEDVFDRLGFPEDIDMHMISSPHS